LSQTATDAVPHLIKLLDKDLKPALDINETVWLFKTFAQIGRPALPALEALQKKFEAMEKSKTRPVYINRIRSSLKKLQSQK
jgi:hypothetical protein